LIAAAKSYLKTPEFVKICQESTELRRWSAPIPELPEKGDFPVIPNGRGMSRKLCDLIFIPIQFGGEASNPESSN
jgi:hypothetical protein